MPDEGNMPIAASFVEGVLFMTSSHKGISSKAENHNGLLMQDHVNIDLYFFLLFLWN